MVFLEVRDAAGRVTRQCGTRCHMAEPGNRSACICGGMFQGVELYGDPNDISTDLIALVRERIVLRPGETIQLRIGA